jgi:hypothetical protein
MVKRMILWAVLSIGLAGACLAQTSGTSDREGGMGMKATHPNQPHGPSITDSGQVRPCNQRVSGTSDRQGGQGLASTESGGPNSNVGGSVSGGC